MKQLKCLSALSACALLATAAQAAPAPQKPATPYDIQTVCTTTIKDANGKTIGQRSVQDHAQGIVGNVRAPYQMDAATGG